MNSKTASKMDTRNDISTSDQLLIAAGDIMLERGSIEFSLSDIAQKSGLNSALVKYYFGNKSGLMMALVRKVVGGSISQLEELLAMPVSPSEKLRIHIAGIVNTYYRYPYINRLLHYMVTEEGGAYGQLIAEEIVKPIIDAEQKILESGVAEGLFRSVDPLLFYFHLVGACDALFHSRYTLQFQLGVNEVTEDLKRKYTDHLYTILLNGLLLPK